MERTEKKLEKMQEVSKKQAEHVTKQMGELITWMVERDKKRDKA